MSHRNTPLAAALAALLMLAQADAALARSKKMGPSASADMGLEHDANGVPIIMKGFRSDRAPALRATPRAGATRSSAARSSRAVIRSARIPRGSSTLPSQVGPTTTGQAVQPHNPPKITTPSDRATNAIHSYPLNKGLGNNPTDQQMYIRQNSN